MNPAKQSSRALAKAPSFLAPSFFSAKATLPLVLGALLSAGSLASAQNVISSGSSLFTPSYRFEAGTTYFGWSTGTWDGDTALETVAGEYLNPIPSINPGNLTGPLLNQANKTVDLLASSNNVYNGTLSTVNTASITLTIPTSGTVGSTGFTTIIIQGLGLSGSAFPGGSGALNSFQFGAINGINPSYIFGTNSAGQGQWFAKYELTGNASTYQVAITGYEVGSTLPVSVTDMVVDTKYSTTGFAPDSAQAVPEPSTLITLAGGAALLGLVRRRRSVASVV